MWCFNALMNGQIYINKEVFVMLLIAITEDYVDPFD